MGYPTVTYTLVNGQTSDAGQLNQNYTDILNGISDGTKDINVSKVTGASTITLSDLTASRGVWTNASKELASNGIDNAKMVFGTGSDAEIYHDGTNFHIDPEASGATTAFIINESGSDCDLRIEGAGDANLLYLDAGNDRIGIRKNNPTVTLDINGPVDISDALNVAGNVGISGDRTTGLCHIIGTTVTPTASGDADELVLDNNANTGMSIFSGAAGESAIYFGDAAGATQGRVVYKNATDSMDLVTNATTALSIDSSQDSTFAGALAITGALTGVTTITTSSDATIGGALGVTGVSEFTGEVGIGGTRTTGKLHIITITTGVTANGDADELVLDGTGNIGESIISGAAAESAVYFGDAAGPTQGRIVYKNATDSMDIVTNASTAISIDSNQDIAIGAGKYIGVTGAGGLSFDATDNASLTGTLYVPGATTSAGKVNANLGIEMKGGDVKYTSGINTYFWINDTNQEIIIGDSGTPVIQVDGPNNEAGFFGATPVTQRAKADYNNWAAFTDVVDALVALGLFDAA